MNNQWSDEQRMKASDFVIVNDEIEVAKKQVDEILNLLKIQ
jgi:dephospho-CoA kinase